MKQIIHAVLAGLLVLATPAAFAHDPAEHAQEISTAGAGPDCAAMKNMDMPTLNMNDPVAQAMHLKCMQVQGTDGDRAGHDMKSMPMPMPMPMPKKTDAPDQGSP